MRRLLALLPLAACSDIAGTWQIDQWTVDGVATDDGGFVDVQQGGATNSATAVAYLLRYAWDPAERAFVPLPQPVVRDTYMNTTAYLEGDGASWNMVIDVVGFGEVPVTFEVPDTENRTLDVRSDAFPHGAVEWSLIR
jgi:hypothetical protein